MLIGVTGSFGTGKTTVSALFKKLGAAVIDADSIVHELYKKDKRIKNAVMKNFGHSVFTGNRIDRTKLGKATFKNKRSLKLLSKIVHPSVIKKIKEKIRKSKKPVIVLDVPLLIEANLHKIVDYVVVVKTTYARQIRRLTTKGITKEDLRFRGSLQLALKEKIKYADFVINNKHSKRHTEKQVIKIWKELTRR